MDLDGWRLVDARAYLAHGLVVFASLLIYLLVARIGQHRRPPSAAVAWVLLIAMLPYAGLPLFLTFGTRKFVRPGRQPGDAGIAGADAADQPGPAAGPAWADDLLRAMRLPPAQRNRAIRFDADGPASRASLFALIASARQRLDISTFILGRDRFGDAVVVALLDASGRGVRVRLLLDAVGSLRASRRHLRTLTAGGVTVRRFMPLLHNPLRGRLNLRNHRKLAVADGQRFWCGGRNLAIEYFDERDGQPAWVDLSFTIDGPLAAQAEARFGADWAIARGWRDPDPAAVYPDEAQPVTTGAAARLVPSGPDLPDDTVYSLLLTAAYHARRCLLAVSPYFVPDAALLAALVMAARRGVAITLIVPVRSNHRLADLARAEALRELAAAGVRIRLHPRMVHAKAVVVDDDFALCGSLNLDGRSLFLNFELMVAFNGSAEVAWLAAWLEQRALESTAFRAVRPSWSREVLEGFVRAVGYQL